MHYKILSLLFVVHRICIALPCLYGESLWDYPDREARAPPLTNVYFAHSEGDGFGYEGGYSTLGVFTAIPDLIKCNLYSFFDCKSQFFNDGRLGTNVGLGARWKLPNSSTIIGLNVYYDYLNEHRVSLQQLGIGYEAIFPSFDFRVNGYLPIGDKCQVRRVHHFFYHGGFVFEQGQQYTPFIGIDTEVGKWIGTACKCNDFTLYLAAGPYYYGRDKCCEKFCGRDHVFGGRGRFIAQFTEHFSLNGCVSYDSLWKGRGQIQLVYSIPFGTGKSGSCSQLDQIVGQPVYRQEIIPVARQRVYRWNWSASAESHCQ